VVKINKKFELMLMARATATKLEFMLNNYVVRFHHSFGLSLILKSLKDEAF